MKISRNSPICLIDSGIGGLSLLKVLTQKYPNENYVYLADNLNMPYGNKSYKWLKSRLIELINYLYETFNAKLIILACNTASSIGLDDINKSSPIKVLGLHLNNLIEGDYKILCTKLCCKSLNNSSAYPCNKLAQDIEDNIFDKITLKRKIKRILTKANIQENNIILGCTHYELVSKEFKDLFPNKNFILPCKEFANAFKLDNYNPSTQPGNILILSTLSTKSYIDKLWKIFKT